MQVPLHTGIAVQPIGATVRSILIFSFILIFFYFGHHDGVKQSVDPADLEHLNHGGVIQGMRLLLNEWLI